MSGAARRSSEPGWLATAGGALLLIVVGFAVGLLAGALFEEPDLVLEQLAGRGETVPVEEVELAPSIESPPAVSAGSAPSAPFVETGPPTAGARPDAAPTRPLASAAPSGAAASGPGFAIQVGAFAEEAPARELESKLRGLGLPGFIAEGPGGGARWRVRVGPIASEEEARRVASRLQAEHRLPTWVLRLEGS